ncbi:MAG: hypothetical protein ACLUFN_06620 [Eubacterium sp.]
MKKVLFVCNSVYQVLVASWIKYHNFNHDSVDIILSERMNGVYDIAERMKKTNLFNDVAVLKVKYNDNKKINSVLKYINFNSFAKKKCKKRKI